MSLLDKDIGNCKALVIDSNPTSRSILASQLRDFGVVNVTQCSRVADARRQLEVREFDVVLCEHSFTDAGYSGQDLLDDLRRASLLPFSTVFVMVTGEASYTQVAEAAESALDSYLLKPHTASSLGERLKQARHRKKVLKEIFIAIEDGDFHDAARLCLQRFHSRGQYWLYAARIGTELLLRLGKHAAAQQLYEAVVATHALPWAKLGIARAQLESGKSQQAMTTLYALIGEDPTYADAYDVLGRAQVDQGKLGEALVTYRQATVLTPGSIARLQKQGMLAFYLGEREESAKALERAASIGISSKMFDHQSLVLLSFARFHQRDTKGLQRCVDNLAHALDKSPDSIRLQRFHAVARILGLMLHRQVANVVEEVRKLARDIRESDFDVEAACNLLALVSQLTSAELKLDAAEDWTKVIALRFCTTRAIGDLLAHAADVHPPYAEVVRACQTHINDLAEKAMTHSLTGDPRSAVKTLLVHGGQTLNAKLIDMARAVLTRHEAKIPDAADLSEMIGELQSRYAASAAQPPLGQDSRAAGGLSLRVNAKVAPEPENEKAA